MVGQSCKRRKNDILTICITKNENFEIYAMTWDDVFLTFNHRESFILDKLKFDKEAIHKEVEAYMKSREGSDNLTRDILGLNTK